MKDCSTHSYVPAEWHPQACIWMAWPHQAELWPTGLLTEVQQEVAALINVLAKKTQVKVLVNDVDNMNYAQALLDESVQFLLANYGDIWLRDTGPIYMNPSHACCFKHNGWGGKYLYPYDDQVATSIVTLAQSSCDVFDVVLEGGAIEHNGNGAILTTRQCLLNENRNSWLQEDAELLLQTAFNATKVYWLDQGLYGDHTDGHVDNLVRFINADTVVCASAYGDDDPNKALYETIQRCISEQGLKVETIPSPGLVLDDDGQIMPASYLNYIMSNKQLILPCYGSDNIDHVVQVFKTIFIDFDVIVLPAKALLTGGGSFHCITQQQVA